MLLDKCIHIAGNGARLFKVLFAYQMMFRKRPPLIWTLAMRIDTEVLLMESLDGLQFGHGVKHTEALNAEQARLVV